MAETGEAESFGSVDLWVVWELYGYAPVQHDEIVDALTFSRKPRGAYGMLLLGFARQRAFRDYSITSCNAQQLCCVRLWDSCTGTGRISKSRHLGLGSAVSLPTGSIRIVLLTS